MNVANTFHSWRLPVLAGLCLAISLAGPRLACAQPEYLWASSMGTTSTDVGVASASDVAGNTYFTGYFTGTIDFDPGPGVTNLTPSGSTDVFVAKYDTDMKLLWAIRMGGATSEAPQAIAVDATGNVYVTGYFFNSGSFGGFPLTSAGGTDVFICKLNTSGAGVWARRVGGSSTDYGRGIAVDASGNVTVAGYFSNTVDFDPGAALFNLASFGGFDAFALHLNSPGNFLWAKKMGGTSFDYAYGVAVDGAGDVLLTGYYDDDANFDDGVTDFMLHSVAGSPDIFVTKLAASTGNLVWAKSLGGDAPDYGAAIATDGSNVYTTGNFSYGSGNPADFDPGPGTFNLTPTPGSLSFHQDVFVSKLDGNGDFVWAVKMGGPDDDLAHAIAVDGSNQVYVTGEFATVSDYDPGPGTVSLVSNGGTDIFSLKLDAGANFVWGFATGGSFDDVGNSIAPDPSGNLIATGSFIDRADFAPGACVKNLQSKGNPDIFIRKFAQDPVSSPLIDGFLPTSGPPGTPVSITGANFSGNPFINEVTFNGNPAVVISGTTNLINTTVPTGTLPGPLFITVGCRTVQSAEPFIPTGPCTLPVAQRNALIDLYNATNGASWTNNTNWLSADESTWFGLTVSGCRVQEIDLSSNNLDGPLNPSIANIVTLERLVLPDNNLTNSLPVSIGDLTALQELRLQNNRMSGSLPTGLASCTALVDLNLQNNSFGGPVPAFLGDMFNLQRLNLSQNFFSSTVPPELGSLANLVELNLSHNQLVGTLPAEIEFLDALQTLDLSVNGLSGNLPPNLGNLSVTTLNLSENQFDGAIPPALAANLNLQSLDLSHNQLNGVVPTEIGNLTNLQFLYLQSNAFAGDFPGSVAPLNLQVVRLQDNAFTSIPEFNSTFITSISVENNQLDFGDLEYNMDCAGFSYSPQGYLPPGGTISFTPGNTLTIPFATAGTANVYQWYANGLPLSGFNSATLVRPGMTLADAGIYFLSVTNALVPGLTLQSTPYLVQSDPCTSGVASSGDLDVSFDPQINDPIYVGGIGIQSTGSIVASINPANVAGNDVDGIIRFLTDGTLDPSFGANDIHSDILIVQPDDKILTTYRFGELENFSGYTRLNEDGSDDTGFSAVNTEQVYALGLQPDGKILVSYITEASPTYLERFESNGDPDPTFSAPEDLNVNVIKAQADGSILLGGFVAGGIMKLDASGVPDDTFLAYTDGFVTDILILSTGKILISGGFGYVNDIPHRGIARLNPDGSLDPTFTAMGITDPSESGPFLTKLAEMTDGRIVASGFFGTINGTDRPNLVRFTADGQTDCSFDPGTSANMPIYHMILQPDDQILISSLFQTYDGILRNGLARVNNGAGSGPPTITSFSPASAALGATVTITGTNFSPIPVDNIVYFGATKTSVTAATTTQLTVTVPGGATFEPVSATVGNLTAYSPKPFIPTFAGGNPIVAASFATHVDFITSAPPRSINLGDLDGDGLADLVVSSQSGSTGIISIYRNTSTPGVISTGSFAPAFDLLKPNSEREGMSLADIDGDGKLEIIAVDVVNNRMSIYLNMATPGTLNAGSFDAPKEFNVGFSDEPRNVDIEDLDADGLPDVVTADYTGDRITIVRNISSVGNIAFESRFYISTGDGARDIAIRDLNGDSKPDLIVANENANTISVLENIADPGTLDNTSFAPAVSFPVDTGPNKISVGDIDGDGKQDIVTANQGASNSVSVLRNTHTGGSIAAGSFAAAVNFTTAGPNQSVELADLNGDTRIDVATGIDPASPQVAVLQNNSTPGTIALNSFVGFLAGPNTQEIALGDLDNDGQTDIATVNSGDNTVSVLRSFSTPTIFITLQPSNLSVCEGSTAMFTTTATGTSNILYQWQFSADGVAPFVDLADGAGYTGTATTSLSVNTAGTFGAGHYRCAISGDLAAPVTTVAVTLTINALPSPPSTTGNFSCGPGAVTLNASGSVNGNYRWYDVPTGGTALSGEINSSYTTPVLSSTTTYYAAIHDGTCECATRTPVVATISTLPAPPGATGASSCTPAALTLMATGGSPGDYRWYTVATGGTALAGETNDTYITPVLTSSTIFHVALFDGTCESTRTPVNADINTVAKPVVTTSNCTATGATLNGPAGFAVYAWSDGGTTQSIPVTAAGSYTLIVTSSLGCVSPPSDPVVFTPAFCNQPPVIQGTSAITTIQGTVTVDIASLITDLDNNVDLNTLQVVVPPSSGALAFFNANHELVVDYSDVPFAGTDQVTIEVCDVSGACVQQIITIEVAGDITVYNALSPNGDGKNDVFFIQYIDALPETQQNKVTIFNRWGSVVFDVENYDNVNRVFRGVGNNGSVLPPGTYYYILEFTSGAPRRTGFISLRQ